MVAFHQENFGRLNLAGGNQRNSHNPEEVLCAENLKNWENGLKLACECGGRRSAGMGVPVVFKLQLPLWMTEPLS